MVRKKPAPKTMSDGIASSSGDDDAGRGRKAQRDVRPTSPSCGEASPPGSSRSKRRNSRDVALVCDTVEVSEALTRAVARNAAFVADLTATVLKEMGLVAPSLTLPAGFLLELGAVLQLGFWERQGYRAHTEFGLPSYSDASKALWARCEGGVVSFEGPDAIELSRSVTIFWIEHFAWEGQSLLASDILVETAEDNEFADTLAEFLWSHRQQLSNLLLGEECQDAK